MSGPKPFISVVTTLYNSASFILPFHDRMKQVLEKITNRYEIILVNDGSPDDSLNVARSLHATENNIKVIDLSRNFGHHPAMMTGLKAAQGELIFLIDSDLEEEPELLATFYDTMQSQSCDVVYGVQEKRKGGWFERISGRIYYQCVNYLCNTKLPENLSTVRLMTRDYLNALMQFNERNVNIAGLWQYTGFEQIPVTFTKLNKQQSSYSLRHKISVLVNNITSFSSKPLNVIFYTGFGILAISTIWIAILIIRYLFGSQPVSGWTSVIVSIWFFCGLTNFFIGIIGIYLSKIFSETKQRPHTIIRKIYNK